MALLPPPARLGRASLPVMRKTEQVENCNDAETNRTGSGQFCQGCTDFGSCGGAVLLLSVRNRPADERNVFPRYYPAAPQTDGNAGCGPEKALQSRTGFSGRQRTSK